jgi:hypothetical protein
MTTDARRLAKLSKHAAARSPSPHLAHRRADADHDAAAAAQRSWPGIAHAADGVAPGAALAVDLTNTWCSST